VYQVVLCIAASLLSLLSCSDYDCEHHRNAGSALGEIEFVIVVVVFIPIEVSLQHGNVVMGHRGSPICMLEIFPAASVT
jgi:hypothetical protein